MSNESQVLQVVSGGTDKKPTAQVALVNADGTEHAASALPALPTADGNYQLTVSSGAYSWTAIV